MNAFRKIRTGLAAVLVASVVPAAALAQGTDLGAILDKKAVKVNKEQVLAMVAGATIKRTVFNKVMNAYVEVTSNVNPNGSVAVMQQTMHGPIRGNGKWRVSDEGQLCSEVEWPRATSSTCQWVFKLGDEVWFSESDSDRSAFTSKASIQK